MRSLPLLALFLIENVSRCSFLVAGLILVCLVCGQTFGIAILSLTTRSHHRVLHCMRPTGSLPYQRRRESSVHVHYVHDTLGHSCCPYCTQLGRLPAGIGDRGTRDVLGARLHTVLRQGSVDALSLELDSKLAVKLARLGVCQQLAHLGHTWAGSSAYFEIPSVGILQWVYLLGLNIPGR
jgi:hypothetical protein